MSKLLRMCMSACITTVFLFLGLLILCIVDEKWMVITGGVAVLGLCGVLFWDFHDINKYDALQKDGE